MELFDLVTFSPVRLVSLVVFYPRYSFIQELKNTIIHFVQKFVLKVEIHLCTQCPEFLHSVVK